MEKEIHGVMCNFILDDKHIAYNKENTNKVFKVYKSDKSFIFGNCLGSIRIILDDLENILGVIYPLMSVSMPYTKEFSTSYILKSIEELTMNYNLYESYKLI